MAYPCVSINLLSLGSLRTGIARSTWSLVQAFAALPTEPRINLLVNTKNAVPKDFICNDNVKIIELGPFKKRIGRIFYEQTALPRLLEKDSDCKVLFSPCFAGPVKINKPHIFTVHDLSFFHNPEYFDIPRRIYYRTVVRTAIKAASHIVTPSEYVRNSIIKHLNIKPENITAIHHGRNELFAAPLPETYLQNICEKYKLRKPFILTVATIEPRKNLLGLFNGLVEMGDKALPLIVAGPPAYSEDAVKSYLASHPQLDVRFLGYVNDDKELSALYHLARIFAFPSFDEGFGLPLLEAMSAGTPVVCSLRSSLPEVAADAAHYFEPDNPVSMARAIMHVNGDENYRKGLINKGYERVKRFSWSSAAEKLAKVVSAVTNGEI